MLYITEKSRNSKRYEGTSATYEYLTNTKRIIILM
jgi:hypothetical protein